ncbi:hypothetical protein Tco_0802245 [Tanacetum coccineum]|uniref:Uncharacterized protein n=1 Tax=Tanacetum coccineum TaxID=301880 RepID=A0ABQ5A2H1_9ASTR
MKASCGYVDKDEVNIKGRLQACCNLRETEEQFAASQLTVPTTTTSSLKASRSRVGKLKDNQLVTSNPYIEPLGSKCFRCRLPGHKSNLCLQRSTYYVEHEVEDSMYLNEAIHEEEC